MKIFFTLVLLVVCVRSLTGQITFSAGTDKAVYTYSDPILVTITGRNMGATPDTLEFGSSCQADYLVDTLDSMHDVICEAVITYAIIPPHDSVVWGHSYFFLSNITGAEVGSGKHSVVARLGFFYRGWVSDTMWVVVTSPTNVNEQGSVPGKYVLSNNYPNPFNPSTTIHFELPKESHVQLQLYNVLGQNVLNILDE